MKKTTYYLTLFSLMILAVSCKDMNALHEAYLKDGEIIYSSKVDSLHSYPGNGRIRIQGVIEDAFNVEEIVVNWDRGESTKSFPYTKTSKGQDTIRLMVDELEEGNYQFDVFSRDADGNQSVPVTVFGTVYGETYRSNLVPRSVNGFAYTAASSWVKFETINTNQRSTEVTYVNAAGAEMTSTLPEMKDTVFLPEYKIGTTIRYRTFYVPSPRDVSGRETALDEFGSDWKDLALPELQPVLESMVFTPVLGGVTINWDNPQELELRLEFVFERGGEEKTQVVESAAAEGVITVAGMENGEQELRVVVADLFDFSFGENFTVTPIPAVLIDKSGWTIVDFSTEEPAEGAPNGLASATIDNDLNTFWHSQWSGASPGFPHWFVVDMGAEKTIASFEVFRRMNDARGQVKHKFYVSNDGVTWTDLGTFDMDPGTNDGQTFAITSNPQARYFKYEATEGPNFFASLGEINVYGLE